MPTLSLEIYSTGEESDVSSRTTALSLTYVNDSPVGNEPKIIEQLYILLNIQECLALSDALRTGDDYRYEGEMPNDY